MYTVSIRNGNNMRFHFMTIRYELLYYFSFFAYTHTHFFSGSFYFRLFKIDYTKISPVIQNRPWFYNLLLSKAKIVSFSRLRSGHNLLLPAHKIPSRRKQFTFFLHVTEIKSYVTLCILPRIVAKEKYYNFFRIFIYMKQTTRKRLNFLIEIYIDSFRSRWYTVAQGKNCV